VLKYPANQRRRVDVFEISQLRPQLYVTLACLQALPALRAHIDMTLWSCHERRAGRGVTMLCCFLLVFCIENYVFIHISSESKSDLVYCAGNHQHNITIRNGFAARMYQKL
jgi:hypothetical protein